MKNIEPISHHDVETLHQVLTHKNVAYLFIGKGAAVLHGFPDTTQDVDIFPRNDTKNTVALIEALTDLGFTIDSTTADEITRGKDFVQLRSGPFDVDLVFAPDGIESFDDAWRRGVRIEEFSGVRTGRHHRKQTPGRTSKGQGNPAPARNVQGVGKGARAREDATARQTTQGTSHARARPEPRQESVVRIRQANDISPFR